jgi:hypothetical protein
MIDDMIENVIEIETEKEMEDHHLEILKIMKVIEEEKRRNHHQEENERENIEKVVVVVVAVVQGIVIDERVEVNDLLRPPLEMRRDHTAVPLPQENLKMKESEEEPKDIHCYNILISSFRSINTANKPPPMRKTIQSKIS